MNSVFGEGASPKLRKLKSGLRAIGFDPDKIVRHRHRRMIYAVPLWDGARDWLCERHDHRPDHVGNPEALDGPTERIAGFWRARWLASRLDHAPTLRALRDGGARRHDAGPSVAIDGPALKTVVG